MPKTIEARKIEAIEENMKEIDVLYKQLLPRMQEIHARNPELCVKNMSDIGQSDAFSRMIDLVPNVQQRMMNMLDEPGEESESLVELYAAQTREIFQQAEAMLAEHPIDPTARMNLSPAYCSSLRDMLLETYERFDALGTPAAAMTKPAVKGRVAGTGQAKGKDAASAAK